MSTLLSRNVNLRDRRTSLRLEPAMWDALEDICHREGCTLGELCSMIEERREQSSLTAAIRVFIVSYYRAAATEAGHREAGHGHRRTLRRRGALRERRRRSTG